MLITLEGPEGGGKSSQARALAPLLAPYGPVTLTREPGGTLLGERVRAVLLAPHDTPPDPLAELLLFAAARAQLLSEVVRPALARGEFVVCDRYSDSTRAYQGGGLGLPSDTVEAAIRLATGGLEPDLTLLLDVEPRVGLRRRRGAGDAPDGGGWNAFDARELAFHQRVRAAYLRLAEEHPARIVVVDASRSAEQVAAEVRRIVLERVLLPSAGGAGTRGG